jgi:phosphoribosyl 1,2-cyclic phosphodiesterase
VRVTVLGSGSRGNAILLESGADAILIDAGFSGREVEERLARVGREPSSLLGIVVTHEHGDHVRGVGVLARRHGTPVHLTEGTLAHSPRIFQGGESLSFYRPGHPFEVGPFRVEPFLTVHDAVDPVAVAVLDLPSRLRVGVATDMGRPTAGVRHALADCHLLVLEANHDERLLREASYPWSVKDRIASSHGHLSNEDAARFAAELLHAELGAIVLAHLSSEANTPELARTVVEGHLRALGYAGVVEVALQDEPTRTYDVETLRRAIAPPQLGLF